MLRLTKFAALISCFFMPLMLFSQPKISFISHAQNHELEKIYADTAALQQLKNLNATVYMGILDFSPIRTQAVQVLNAWGIPVKAQLLLDRKNDYRLTIKNASYAKKRYEEFLTWVAKDSLKFDGMGLAIEPLLEDIQELNDGKVGLAIKAYKRLNESELLEQAQITYQNLITQMQSDGYRVDAFVYPLILDAKKVNSKAFQQLTGLIELNVDKEIPLFFTNYLDEQEGHRFMISYGKDNKMDAIALGSTGGELSIKDIPVPTPLNWAFLERDMYVATQYTNDLYIFSLDGCLEKAYLKNFELLRWEEGKTLVDTYDTSAADNVRANMNYVLKVLEYPILLGLGLGLVLLLTVIAIWRLLSRIIST